MNIGKFLLLTLYFFIIILTVTMARDYYSSDKRAGDRPFMMSSRYGRAGGGLNGGKHVVVAPRTDKFFLASRYGKRSSVFSNLSMDFPKTLPVCGSDENLSCTYTGFTNLYRCSPKKENENEEITIK